MFKLDSRLWNAGCHQQCAQERLTGKYSVPCSAFPYLLSTNACMVRDLQSIWRIATRVGKKVRQNHPVTPTGAKRSGGACFLLLQTGVVGMPPKQVPPPSLAALAPVGMTMFYFAATRRYLEMASSPGIRKSAGDHRLQLPLAARFIWRDWFAYAECRSQS
jgi:hypothetical protein